MDTSLSPKPIVYIRVPSWRCAFCGRDRCVMTEPSLSRHREQRHCPRNPLLSASSSCARCSPLATTGFFTVSIALLFPESPCSWNPAVCIAFFHLERIHLISSTSFHGLVTHFLFEVLFVLFLSLSFCAQGGTPTRDPEVKSCMLCRLSQPGATLLSF